ncbi:uncharacterized protein LOC124288272 [Haliotis rubra]|uniref:uncharacterized protein LOC124288272 n=1 Tax=Haliotis rubra TaxID=36100 RepID=UPI001EE5524E|nr:uncharacterized protein LOC124288272 [Haliotis rubra]
MEGDDLVFPVWCAILHHRRRCLSTPPLDDEVFSMRQMDPDQQIFNCRLSRARRVVENTFGILAMRFQILLGSLNSTADRAEQITLACVTLHNMLRTRNRNSQMNLTDQGNEDCSRSCTQLLDGDNRGARNVTPLDGASQRNYLKNYFMGPGAVHWQEKMISK